MSEDEDITETVPIPIRLANRLARADDLALPFVQLARAMYRVDEVFDENPEHPDYRPPAEFRWNPTPEAMRVTLEPSNGWRVEIGKILRTREDGSQSLVPHKIYLGDDEQRARIMAVCVREAWKEIKERAHSAQTPWEPRWTVAAVEIAKIQGEAIYRYVKKREREYQHVQKWLSQQ